MPCDENSSPCRRLADIRSGADSATLSLPRSGRQLLISERHELVTRGQERISDYNFVMRCWERDELNSLLARHHFGRLSCFGAYDPAVAIGATDRLVVVAQRVDVELPGQ
jgi:hypothetical protein